VQLKAVLVDAVLGRGVPPEYADLWERAGLCVFTGNQHNERWSFLRSTLEQLNTDELYQLYCETKRRD
jgi:phage pi2 protein 07